MPMRKIMAGVLAPLAIAAGIALAPPANAAQGGWDRDHWWMKVARSELATKTVDTACKEVYSLRGGGCNNLIVLIVQQKMGNPRANGYWAEWWPNPYRTRAGVW